MSRSLLIDDRKVLKARERKRRRCSDTPTEVEE